jgi:hypothetical protein
MLSSQPDPKSSYPKFLPGWLELDYFRRPRSLRSARKWLTAGACLVGVLVLLATLVPRYRWMHEARPVSTAHAMFNDDCGVCHRLAFAPLGRLVSGDDGRRSVQDADCVACHAGPKHHPQARDVACATCHREHQGRAALAWVADSYCTACHADLKKEDEKAVAMDVSAFASHPEFWAVRPGQPDPSRVRFSHKGHLELDLRRLKEQGRPGLTDFGDRLDCAACHRPDADRRYMQPIRYEDHCKGCHPLSVQVAGDFRDAGLARAAEAFGREPAPHREPEVVRAVLRDRYLQFAKDHPLALGDSPPDRTAGRVPGRRPEGVTEQEWVWVKGQLAGAENLLFVNKQVSQGERQAFAWCSHCHYESTDPARRPDGLPRYEKTDILARWFTNRRSHPEWKAAAGAPEPTNTRFDHASHQMLKCIACHGGAESSERATDVLLPSVDNCRVCHNGTSVGARVACVECHTYHDHTREQSLNGKKTLNDFARGQ